MRNFILGTDWWTDCDDAVAIKLLANAVLARRVGLLGIGINACMADSTASLTNFLKDCGLPDVPIGIDREATDFGGNPPYQKRLAAISGGVPGNDSVPDAVQLYLRLLRESKEPVEIIEIGYPQVLARVLESAPELFREKVAKLWVMAGKWDENPGRENNFARNLRSARAGHFLCEHAPVPVTFLGFEAGVSVITGGRLSPDSLLHQVLADHGSPEGRSSWDPMLVQMAVLGDEERAGYRLVRGTASVDAETGWNTFHRSETGLHGYVRKRFPDEYYRDRIDRELS